MKIAYVTAGAAGMLCGSCIHDNTLATARELYAAAAYEDSVMTSR